MALESMTIDELVDNFSLFDNWEDRYSYLIDLGRQLDPMPDALKTEESKVRGCVSQVWLVATASDVDPTALHFIADSDAHIVRGLVAVLLSLYSDQPAAAVASSDAETVLEKLGLAQHLSPNRRNGLRAMVERMRLLSSQHAAAGSPS